MSRWDHGVKCFWKSTTTSTILLNSRLFSVHYDDSFDTVFLKAHSLLFFVRPWIKVSSATWPVWWRVAGETSYWFTESTGMGRVRKLEELRCWFWEGQTGRRQTSCCFPLVRKYVIHSQLGRCTCSCSSLLLYGHDQGWLCWRLHWRPQTEPWCRCWVCPGGGVWHTVVLLYFHVFYTDNQVVRKLIFSAGTCNSSLHPLAWSYVCSHQVHIQHLLQGYCFKIMQLETLKKVGQRWHIVMKFTLSE